MQLIYMYILLNFLFPITIIKVFVLKVLMNKLLTYLLTTPPHTHHLQCTNTTAKYTTDQSWPKPNWSNSIHAMKIHDMMFQKGAALTQLLQINLTSNDYIAGNGSF